MDITNELKDLFGERLKLDEPMSKHTNYRIGGPAKWFVDVRDVNELKSVLNITKETKTPVFVFGGGSNMLVSDDGFNGVVIKIAMRNQVISEDIVIADAGVLSSSLARATAKAGLKGLVWAVSLPGTIGGAVRGNAGCFGGEIKDNLISVEVLRDGDVITLKKDDLNFGYRESSIKHSNDIVLSAKFKLEKGDSAALLKEIDQKLQSRKDSQPLDAGSAGCLFKNYEIKDDAEMQHLVDIIDIPVEMRDSRRISAGWLIDKADLKGFKIGGAQISIKHGNFIVNSSEATAEHVAQIMAVVKEKVHQKFGILLQEEVQYVGF